jgi:hypothetical protein
MSESIRLNPRFAGGFALVLAILFSFVTAAGEPRLLFGPEDIPELRQRRLEAPYNTIFSKIVAVASTTSLATYDNSLFSRAAQDFASIYAITGSTSYAEKARQSVLGLINDASFWAVDSSKGLTRARMGQSVALAYDWCKDAWDASTRTLVSQKLLAMGESLYRSGGEGWPSNPANNWRAVRYSAMGMCYLATDETIDTARIQTAYDQVKLYLYSNLTGQSNAMGWNPEGSPYTSYPAQFWGVFNQAIQRYDPTKNLLNEYPAVGKTLSTLYVGTVGISRGSRLGVVADWSDGGTGWSPNDALPLAWVNSDPSLVPAMKWQYDRLCGAQGDASWSTDNGAGMFNYLYYPKDVVAQNPADVRGKTFYDPAFGITMFRNRYQDQDDFISFLNAKTRAYSGTHNGDDCNGFRIIGLNAQWVLGSGRYYTDIDPRGESTVFRYDPLTSTTNNTVATGSVVANLCREEGDGYAVAAGSSVGVTNHRRRFLSDYSGYSGCDGLFVIADTSTDGNWWRMSTAEYNNVEFTADGFIVTSPDGNRMFGRILHGNAGSLRTGTFQRHFSLDYEGVSYMNDKWIDFTSADGQFLVVLAIVRAGQPAPAFSTFGDGVFQTLSVNRQVITVGDTSFDVLSWDRPGDADWNGIVDVTDLGNLATFYGKAGGWANGDFSGDGVVDVTDLGILATHYGDDYRYPDQRSIAIPEPSMLLILLFAVPLIQHRRRPVA